MSGKLRNLIVPSGVNDDCHLKHLTKKESRKTPKERGPPKLKRRTLSSRKRSTSSHEALSISFQKSPEENNPCQTPLQKRSPHMTYFLDNFVDIRKIGEGSFGEVFEARCVENNLLYAIKRTKEPFIGVNDRKSKLEEVKKLEMIPKHENCVEFVAAWEEDDQLYIQLELCQMSLSEYSEAHPQLPDSTLWSILFDLLSAVKHLHDHQLIHLDIKLENILIALNGRYKLGDFGLVVDLEKDNMADATEGDPKYLAPELLSGNFTKAADVFSVGITMLELATNLELPSGGRLWHELRNGIFPEEHTNRICPELLGLIKRMMAPIHTNRPSVNELFDHPHLSAMKLENMARNLCPEPCADSMCNQVLTSVCELGCSVIGNMMKKVFLKNDTNVNNVTEDASLLTGINDQNSLSNSSPNNDDSSYRFSSFTPTNVSKNVDDSTFDRSCLMDLDSFDEGDASGSMVGTSMPSTLYDDISPIMRPAEQDSSFDMNYSIPAIYVTNSTPGLVPTTPRKRSSSGLHGITPLSKKICTSTGKQVVPHSTPLETDDALPLKPRNLLSVFHDCESKRVCTSNFRLEDLSPLEDNGTHGSHDFKRPLKPRKLSSVFQDSNSNINRCPPSNVDEKQEHLQTATENGVHESHEFKRPLKPRSLFSKLQDSDNKWCFPSNVGEKKKQLCHRLGTVTENGVRESNEFKRPLKPKNLFSELRDSDNKRFHASSVDEDKEQLCHLLETATGNEVRESHEFKRPLKPRGLFSKLRDSDNKRFHASSVDEDKEQLCHPMETATENGVHESHEFKRPLKPRSLFSKLQDSDNKWCFPSNMGEKKEQLCHRLGTVTENGVRESNEFKHPLKPRSLFSKLRDSDKKTFCTSTVDEVEQLTHPL